jgi:hypothetical protein
MFTLKHLLLGRVVDVVLSDKSGRIYLALNAEDGLGSPGYLLPLLCPVCGQSWHFVWNDSPEKLAETLREAMKGFQLVFLQYFARTSSENIASAMNLASLGAGPSEILIENAADHLDEQAVFPVISLSFEKRVPSSFPTPEELRAMPAHEVRELLDLDSTDSVEDAILGVAEWMADEDYEDFDIDDDIMLVVHPSAVLDAVIVEPDYLDEDSQELDYKSALDEMESIDLEDIFSNADDFDLDDQARME